MVFVSEADKQHMRRLGAALDAQLSRRRQAAARRPAGRNLELGLRMSVEWMDLGGIPDEPLPIFSLAQLWRRAQESGDGPPTESP